MADPLVSVIIPCRNQGGYLAQALDSVLTQTYRNTEIVVIDDGSTDGTSVVAESYGERVRLLRRRHGGPSASRNSGLRIATGRWVQFLDADDWLLPGKISACLDAHEPRAGLQVVYTDYLRAFEDTGIDPTRSRLYLSPRMDCARPLEDIARRWERKLSIPIHCPLLDARLFREYGLRFDERLPNHVDWDIWMRVMALEPTVTYVDEPLAVYRYNPRSVSTADRRRMGEGFLLAIRLQRRRFRQRPDILEALDEQEAWVRAHYADALSPEPYRAWYWSPRARAVARALVPFGPRQMIRKLLDKREPDGR